MRKPISQRMTAAISRYQSTFQTKPPPPKMIRIRTSAINAGAMGVFPPLELKTEGIEALPLVRNDSRGRGGRQTAAGTRAVFDSLLPKSLKHANATVKLTPRRGGWEQDGDGGKSRHPGLRKWAVAAVPGGGPAG